MSLIDGATDVRVTLGQNFRSIIVGDSATPEQNDVDSGTLELTAYQGADLVEVNADTTGNTTIAVDQAASTTLGFFFDNGLPNPALNVTGSVGTPGAAYDLAVFIGDNWPLTVSPVTVTGNLFIDPPALSLFPVTEPASPISITNEPGNGDNVTVNSATIGGLLQIFEAAGNESVTVGTAGKPVVTNDLDVETFSNPGDTVGLTVTNTSVTDPSGVQSAYIQDHGAGNDNLSLGGNGAAGDPLGLGGGAVEVASVMQVYLAGSATSVNHAQAENVSALSDAIDGGSLFGSLSDFTGVNAIYGNINLTVSNFTTVT
jgi:hypothetical protein